MQKDETYSRPIAAFTEEGLLELRASAALGCRRALWYSATGYQGDPPDARSLMIMEAGTALEPVVLRAMARDGWEVTPIDPSQPVKVTLTLSPLLVVGGHPDAIGFVPLLSPEDEPSVIEVKTRGPAAFQRWQTLGAERSHPESVGQASFYTYGLFGEPRDLVIATMDTGSRGWDYEVIPQERVQQALAKATDWLMPLEEHHRQHGPDAKVLPPRDFEEGHWRCTNCPYRRYCRPEKPEDAAVEEEAPERAEPPVSEAEAENALRRYEEVQASIRDAEEEKRVQLQVLGTWLHQRGEDKAQLEGSERCRNVSRVRTTRYSVDYKKLNNLLSPEVRETVVAEKVSEYVRVS